MGFWQWAEHNWFELFQTAAIVGGLVTIRRDKRKEQVQNLIRFTERHREIWQRHDSEPDLRRVREESVNLVHFPVTEREENFVRDVINHLRSTVFASDRRVYIQPAALPEDIQSFFALPIPNAVWHKTKVFYDRDFVAFVEKHF